MKLGGRAQALLAVAALAAAVGLVCLWTDALRGPEHSDRRRPLRHA